MTALKIAIRNTFRNTRRSLMTISAIAVGGIAVLLFGEFFMEIMLGLQTDFVTRSGHVAIFKHGFFDFGSGNPGAYSIENYREIIEHIKANPEWNSKIHVITPTIRLFGIAGFAERETSKTFFATGVIPANVNEMRKWDEYHLKWDAKFLAPVLTSDDETHGVIGSGLARILGLCERFNLKNCPPREDTQPPAPQAAKTRDFGDLGKDDFGQASLGAQAPPGSEPRLDLLASTASGAPNVVSFFADRAVHQGIKEYDDAYVAMNFFLAQKLLFGRQGDRANGIVVQLWKTEDMMAFKEELQRYFPTQNWDLEVRDLTELEPFYMQAVAMFRSIFVFVAAIMGLIALFTVVNTMSMSVMERTNEIGTIRALGVKKKAVVRQFILEGTILGVVGASFGIAIGSVLAVVINHSGLTWFPPGQSAPVPLMLLTHGVGRLLLGIWLGLVVMSSLAAWFPARRAAQFKVVDALGHV